MISSFFSFFFLNIILLIIKIIKIVTFGKKKTNINIYKDNS